MKKILNGLLTIALVGSSFPSQSAGRSLTFTNNCSQPVSLTFKHQDQSLTTYSIKSGAPNARRIPVSSLAQNGANAFFSVLAATTGSRLCNTSSERGLDCGVWGAQLNSNNSNGSDWLGNWANYATVCQATLSRANACSKNAQPGCCGPLIDNDGTFGSLFEITPNGAYGLDFIDISTNYNINNGSLTFFSIPYNVVAKGAGACVSNGIAIPKNTLTCLTADCADGYQYATDAKQVSCPATMSYTVTFCPKTGKHPYK